MTVCGERISLIYFAHTFPVCLLTSAAAFLNGSTMAEPRHPPKRGRVARSTVHNSTDNEFDAETTVVDTSNRSASTRRMLQSVSIPVMNSRTSRGRLSTAKPQPNAQESSNGSPSFDDSDDETTGTSISTTPAASIRRGKTAARKSGLSKAVTASLGSSSSLKRSRDTVMDSEDEDEVIDADAELALQMQMEEDGDEDEHQDKRLKIEDADEDSDDKPLAFKRQLKGRNSRNIYTGKGKGKAKPSMLDDSDSMLEELTTPPTYEGKGKGKAKAEDVSHNRSRSARASAKKATFVDDGFMSLDRSDEEEDFQPDDASSGLSELETPIVSDDDDEPLMTASARSKKTTKITAKTPAKVVKPKRGKKNFTRAERDENENRRSRWAHIPDKWDRKRAMNRERAEQKHPKLLSMWKDLEKVSVLPTEMAEQPQSINRRLKPFQLEGLNWMIRQEKTHYKGGLLGDEMGMGKTIQAVSLIMSDYPAKEPTLVCVPPVALMQWSNEIREYTDNKLKVLVYHGTNAKCKKMKIKELRTYDVIMVSYNSLESLHRKETKGWSRGEDIIKESSPLHAITYHRLILDEAHSIKSRNTGVAKACFALKGDYKWCLSGTPVQNRIGEFFSLLRFLEVRPFADYFCRSCDCEKLHWATDDDHMCIACNHGASEHISVFNQELLNPITGDDAELREDALTKLHMITARIMLRRMKRDHTNSMVSSLKTTRGVSANNLQELPMKDIIIHNEFFSNIERDFSSSIMTNSARNFDTYVAQGVMLNNYANIFGLIMQMRQVANHPDLLLKKKGTEGAQNVYVCNICDEPAEDAVRSRCHHEFCRACVKDYMETCEASGTNADCPRCHIALTIDFEQPELEQDEESVKKNSIINRIKMENWTSSTKIEMLIYDLYKLRSKKQTLKSIVFSQFTSMLQLIEWRLRRAGFNTVMLDGSMTPAQRQKSIDYFMTNSDVEVFLVSLKAGGVALNLTEASRVFIVDP
jgi:DNA repair protein RAD16